MNCLGEQGVPLGGRESGSEELPAHVGQTSAVGLAPAAVGVPGCATELSSCRLQLDYLALSRS